MSTNGNSQTYYEILEVSIDTPQHEIVTAYQRAKEAYAPDSPALYTMFTKEEATELRRLIEEAFLTLGNQKKRKEYDLLLLKRKNPATHHVLPDFAPASEPTKQAAGAATQHKMTDPSTRKTVLATTIDLNQNPSHLSGTLPDGFARTRLAVYEIKPELEQEIKAQKVFDGAFIRKIRQYKNINIEQLSKETRISRSYLAALESDDYEALPAPVFVRGFIVQVARSLQIDENLAASSYMERMKSVGKA